MDLSAHSYRTILRSHNDEIKQIEYHRKSNLILTLSLGKLHNLLFYKPFQN